MRRREQQQWRLVVIFIDFRQLEQREFVILEQWQFVILEQRLLYQQQYVVQQQFERRIRRNADRNDGGLSERRAGHGLCRLHRRRRGRHPALFVFDQRYFE